MEYLVFALFAFGFIVVIMVAGFIQEKSSEKKFVQSLRSDYGQLPKREYKPEQYANISHYFLKHKEPYSIDDITWNDLDMDEIFKKMNYTYSAAGEEYLYYTLRTPVTEEAVLLTREQIIAYFEEHEDDRVAWQLLFAKLGRTGKFSIYDYLDYLDALGIRSNAIHYLAIGAFIAALGSMFFSASMGVLVLVGVLCFNLLTYFKKKKEVDPYITSFTYIFRLLHCVDRIEKCRVPVLKEQIDELIFCKKSFRKFKRGSYLLMSSARMSASGNPLEIIIDYMRMAFHLDMIKFNSMLAEVRKHTSEIDRMLTIVGSIEAGIAIGAFRKGNADEMHGYCIPQFQKGKRITGTGMYHPLIQEPVKNNINTGKSVLLTGSNASGKSTFLKTVAINGILAQTVHTCMAEAYCSAMFRIYSSMSLRDDVRGGDSYYMTEIKSIKRILDGQQGSGTPVLCFVDEVLRGTNTVERIAASTQILRSLDTKNGICFAATHDIELTHLLAGEYENYHFKEIFIDEDITFPYKIMEGSATTRNAIKLLSVMGYEPRLIRQAEALAENFIKKGKWIEEVL